MRIYAIAVVFVLALLGPWQVIPGGPLGAAPEPTPAKRPAQIIIWLPTVGGCSAAGSCAGD